MGGGGGREGVIVYSRIMFHSLLQLTPVGHCGREALRWLLDIIVLCGFGVTAVVMSSQMQ